MSGDLPLQSFTGGAPDFDIFRWLKHLELLVTANGWSEHQNLCSVCASFEGPAAVWLDTITLADCVTWPELRSLMIHRFGDSLEYLYAKLDTLQQGESTGIGLYTDKFYSLLKRLEAQGQHMPAVMTLSCYYQVLTPNLRDCVVLAHPSSLQEAYQYALYYEQALSGLCLH